MDDQQPVGQRARDEAIVTAVYVMVMVIGGIILQITQRRASDPDGFRSWRMKAFKAAERFAATTAAKWWELAERARCAYEAERS